MHVGSDAGRCKETVPSGRLSSHISPVTLLAGGADTQSWGYIRGRVSTDWVSGDTGSTVRGQVGGEHGAQEGRWGMLGLLMTDPVCFRVGQRVLNYIYLAQGHVKEKSPSDPAQHKPEVCAQGRGSGSKGGAGMVRSCVTARPGEGRTDVKAGGGPCR